MTEQAVVAERREFDGARWINYRPTQEEVAAWFENAVEIDPALERSAYLGGVTLIPAVDSKAPTVTGFTERGLPMIDRREELSFNPYARVETRIKYWWDLLAAHPEWVGMVEHVASPRMPIDLITEEERREIPSSGGSSGSSSFKRRQPGALTLLVHQLPEGFSIMSVPVSEGYSHFLCCTIRVSIYSREDLEANQQGKLPPVPLRTGRGTKQVPLLTGRNPPYADANSLMRAETGAHGRALGFAGIFVLAGSGVATAEDMLEAIAQGQPPVQEEVANQGPPAPTDKPLRTGAELAAEDENTMRDRAIALWKTLARDHPTRAEEFGQWARQRRVESLGSAQGTALRAATKKLEVLTEQAKHQETNREPTPTPVTPGTPDADGEPGGSPG